MFADSAKIYIRSGKGGDGHVSFRRELFVAAGGPDGGDGGRGGDVIFEVDDGLNTLTDFRHVRKYVAGDGEQGGKRRCHGADGEDMIVKVPEGTVIKDFESGKVIADMSGENRREVILKGGKGGLGNMHFATSTMQVPKYAQPGQPAQELWVQLELKVIADVGLVGFPNVGKSTLLSRVSNARPKIANYHFTTLNPHLGVVDLQDGQGFVMADIPGLIEGASQGIGLGHDFLRHIDRCRLLVHVVDVSGSEGRDPVEDFDAINAELSQYSPDLATRPQIVVANKTDIMEDESLLEKLRAHVEPLGYPLFALSAASHTGTRELVLKIAEKLSTLPPVTVYEPEYVPKPVKIDASEPLKITVEDNTYIVEGKWLERLMSNVNFGDYESRMFFDKMLRENGVFQQLEDLGIKDGDIVSMYELEFEYQH